MFPAQHEEEHKFWKIPEMIAKLLPFLDLKSTLCLARCHKKTQNILEGSLVWHRLIKRSSPLNQRDKVKDLVAILKLMKDPKGNLPDVLDAICEANPPKRNVFYVRESVKISCPRHLQLHSISLLRVLGGG